MTVLQNRQTWSIYRDEPVEHVHDAGNHYECMVCHNRIWTSCKDALEEFLTEHDECAKEIA